MALSGTFFDRSKSALLKSFRWSLTGLKNQGKHYLFSLKVLDQLLKI